MATLNKIIGGKEAGTIRLEFSENVVLPNKNPNLLALLNQKDERFKTSAKPITGWGNLAQTESFFKMLDSTLVSMHGEEITLEMLNKLTEGEEIEVYKENFNFLIDGVKYPVHLQITETDAPINEWQLNNMRKAAKQIKIDGVIQKRADASELVKSEESLGLTGYFVANGRLIFRKVEVIAGTPNHKIIQHEKIMLFEEVVSSINIPVANAPEKVKVETAA